MRGWIFRCRKGDNLPLRPWPPCPWGAAACPWPPLPWGAAPYPWGTVAQWCPVSGSSFFKQAGSLNHCTRVPALYPSIVGSLRDLEVACSASDRQGSNFESCVWRTVSSQSSHHFQEVLLAQFSLYVHKGGLKPDSFHFFVSQIERSSQ